MSDKDEKNRPSAKTDQEGKDLWVQAMSDVKPLPGNKGLATKGKRNHAAPVRVTYGDKVSERCALDSWTGKTPGPGIDKRTDERLRRGEMVIEGRLDLHGLDQDRARDALEKFIEGAYTDGKRCVLIITGTGRKKQENQGEEEWFMPQKGVLKQKVPEWLAGEKLSPLIVQTHQAQGKHGGDGALYVLLRRHRQKQKLLT